MAKKKIHVEELAEKAWNWWCSRPVYANEDVLPAVWLSE